MAPMDEPLFPTASGVVSGTFRRAGNTRISVYRAIPVAETSPFGSPVPPSLWTGVLDCSDTQDRRLLRLPTTVSVFAPANADQSSLPVIAWIHGGRYEEGHGDDGWYDGSSLASQGCVVVTLNYRKRLEGFLPLNDDAPGEFRGIDDLVHALTWVQNAIPAVGGDPKNVTLIGQSAGGGLAMALLTDRRADELFHRAVVLSPGLPRILPHIGWRLRRALIRRKLGVPLNRQQISTVDNDQLAMAYRTLAQRYFADCPVGPGPLDFTALREVPLMVSTMRDELVRYPGVPKIDSILHRRRIPTWTLSPAMLGLGVPRRNLKKWRRVVTTTSPHRVMGKTISDTTIRRWAAGLLEAAPGTQRWSCEFHGGNWKGRHIDAGHCAELPLLFDTLELDEDLSNSACGPDAVERSRATGERFRAAVLAFARTGDPGWTPYSHRRASYIFNLTGGTDHEAIDSMPEVRTLLPITSD